MVTFTDEIFVIQDRALRSLIEVSKVVGGVFRHKRVPEFEVQANTVDTKSLWHKRLGHPSSQVSNVASSTLNIDVSAENKSNEPCDVCFQAKKTRCQFYESDSSATELFALIHCDIWGAYRTP